MGKPVLIDDAELMKHVKGAVVLASAIGHLEMLKGMEEKPHSRRTREINKSIDVLNKLLDCYPRAWEYDLVDLGIKFFDGLDEKLDKMIRRGLVINGEKLVPVERWKRGDVLEKGKTVGIIAEVKDDGYNIVVGPALLYSDANWPSDPYLAYWDKIDELGENCSDKDISGSVYLGKHAR